MTFGEAISWCKSNGATWTFGPTADRRFYVLSLHVEGTTRIDIRRREATEWACMLLDAIDVHLERIACGGEPTQRLRRPTFAPGAPRSSPRLRAAS